MGFRRGTVRLSFLAAALAAALSIPAARAADKVSISEGGATVFRLPLYIAVQNGYFTAEGIDLEVVETRSGSDGIKMLVGKSIEFQVGPMVDAIQVHKQGITLHGIALLTNRMTNSIMLRRDLADSIKTMRDLKGHTLGVTGVGSGSWQFALFVAAQEGLKGDDFNIIGVGTGAGVIGALTSKRIDALSYGEPETLQMAASGDAVFLVDLGDPAVHQKLIGGDYLNDWIVTRPDYAAEHPQTVQHFVNAIEQALNWLDGRKPEEVATVLTGFTGFQGADAKILAASVQRMGIPKTAETSQTAYDAGMRVPLTVGALDAAIPFNDLVDNSFAAAAAKAYPPKP